MTLFTRRHQHTIDRGALPGQKKEFGDNIEVSTLNGLTWRAGGHTINRGQRNGFTIVGVEPAIRWKFGDAWVAAAGVLFTVAGQKLDRRHLSKHLSLLVL